MRSGNGPLRSVAMSMSGAELVELLAARASSGGL